MMLCSVIIPTIGRSTLDRAVISVLDQEFDTRDFEVIVVNDSGQPLVESDWQESNQVCVLNTNRRERSVARNSGAAIAMGRYLQFLDDDDWIFPGAFKSLSKLAKTNRAAWLYGGYRLVNQEDELLEEYYPDERGNCLIRFLAGEWLPLQTSWIQSEAFFSVGGFASLESLLGGDEDVDLSRRISLFSDIAGTSNLVASIRIGHKDSTTNYTNLREQSRQSREKILNAKGAFTRMRNSAYARKTEVSYWQGRITWNYLTSVVWNIQRKKLFTAASRMVFILISLGLAGKFVFSRSFWSGATRPHNATGWLKSGRK